MAAINQKIPPHNDEAEKSVLGAMLLNPDALYDALEILTEEDFYSEMHREIFRAAKELYKRNEPVDTLTISDELKRRKSLEMVGGRAYIAALSTMVPATSNAAQYARIVAEKAILRRLIGAAGGIMDEGYSEELDARTVLDHAEQSIFKIAQSRQKKDYTIIRDVLWENIKRIDELSRMDGGLTGLTTGFIDLDRKTSGLQKSDLIIVAARPGMGKTAFALNIAQKAAVRAEAKVLIFSLEMSREQLGQRLLSIESHVDITKLRDGKVENEWPQINEALDVFSKTSIYIDDTPGISAMEIKNKARRLKAEKGLDLIIIDYLQLMAGDSRAENRQQEITAITRMLKQLAREMDCPVIVLSQLSRAVEQRTGKKPMLSDLRESGAIEQDADIVIFLYRDDYYNEDSEDRNTAEVIIAKHRNGETGSIELTWVGRYTKFADKTSADVDYASVF